MSPDSMPTSWGGLPLPFGDCAGVELLDTLEVPGHERHQDLPKGRGPRSAVWEAGDPRRPQSSRYPRPGMAEHVRVRKVSTRDGRPEMLDDGHIVEGDEVAPPTPGLPYLVRRTVMEHDEANDVFNTSPIRAVMTDRDGGILLLTDNSRYAVEVVGH